MCPWRYILDLDEHILRHDSGVDKQSDDSRVFCFDFDEVADRKTEPDIITEYH